TGFFRSQSQASALYLQPSNSIFARKLALGLTEEPHTFMEDTLVQARAQDIPHVLNQLRRQRHSHAMLVKHTLRRLRRLTDGEFLITFLRSMNVLFDLRWSALFIVPENPPKRIMLLEAQGRVADVMRQQREDLGWSAGLSQNSWLRDVLDL